MDAAPEPRRRSSPADHAPPGANPADRTDHRTGDRADHRTGDGTADPSDDLTGVLTAVGPRLRALRKARGVTLAQLGESTGISVSTLSRLEAGQRKPTLELLLPLARAHRVALDELVGAPATGDPRVHAKPFTRYGQTFVPLTRRLDGLAAYKQILPGNASGATPDLEQRVHEGYDWIYVLAGRLRLLLGDHDLILTPGQAAEFDTRTPHVYVAAGPEPVELLTLFGPQGERIHVRAKPKDR
ncbi:helix-turn-helix domain-containing protein [Streptantibioticus silvisoli]|uniref:Helix-turn-helix domain-containing protein n=1 Tax=Streptantibioticus silvisoli TaxID=2705255 RepID=A0ABT6W7G9_9ACTN|nr:helix-turn-helix domain-containing protein [Streptantibioticus silvisoli]MDI5966594.1 helix-turn-helix domain-containing protein [Streptantibioticus silvisoli]